MITKADCEGCPLVPERREFLRSVSALALAAISLGLPIRSASAKVLASSIAGRKQLSYPLPAVDGADIDRDNDVILVRYKNEVFAFNLSCPHQNTALRWNETRCAFNVPSITLSISRMECSSRAERRGTWTVWP